LYKTAVVHLLDCYTTVSKDDICSPPFLTFTTIIPSTIKMLLKVIFASLAFLPAAFTQNGSFFQVTEDFGPNPTNVQFWLYIPPGVGKNAPLIVNPHWCTGTAATVFHGSGVPLMAETYKYIMIFPETPRASKW
jgi:poly(3-hydroxybutyrate) depolymerase